MDCATEDVLTALMRHLQADNEEVMLRLLNIDCRWCACTRDAMRTLITGSHAEIEEQVKHRLHVLGRHGGFILGPSPGFLPEIPVQNIVLLYDAGYDRPMEMIC